MFGCRVMHSAYVMSVIWIAKWETVPSDMCAQRRLKSACAPALSDLSLRCPYEETLQPWPFKMCAVKIQISMRIRACWSESSLGAHVRMTFFLPSRLISLALICHIIFASTILCQYQIQNKTWNCTPVCNVKEIWSALGWTTQIVSTSCEDLNYPAYV